MQTWAYIWPNHHHDNIGPNDRCSLEAFVWMEWFVWNNVIILGHKWVISVQFILTVISYHVQKTYVYNYIKNSCCWLSELLLLFSHLQFAIILFMQNYIQFNFPSSWIKQILLPIFLVYDLAIVFIILILF